MLPPEKVFLPAESDKPGAEVFTTCLTACETDVSFVSQAKEYYPAVGDSADTAVVCLGFVPAADTDVGRSIEKGIARYDHLIIHLFILLLNISLFINI
jgi:hypothetical protein